MVFSSIIFLWVLLPCILLLYYVSPKPFKNGILTVFSLFFYAWGEPRYVVLMIFSVLLNYGFGRLVEKFGKKRWLLALCVTLNLLLLGYFKYYNFLAEVLNPLLRGFDIALPAIQVTLPIGISFYTFQALSYVVDVYRGENQAQKNPLNMMLYISFFPQLIAGPIVKYHDIEEQIENRTVTLEGFSYGVKRFIFGLGKKVILANTFAEVVDAVYAYQAADVSQAMLWLTALLYMLQIYFDFSGYSDMAIGLGKMFGFTFIENFRLPYTATSIQDFWRKWHISLSSWFKEYVYIPLGGNRRGTARTYVNLWTVFLLTGIWHGANWNFICWGLYYFVLLAAEKLFLLPYLKKGKVWPHFYTLFLVVVGWAMFVGNDTGVSFGLLFQKLFVPSGGVSPLYFLRNYGVLLAVSVVCCTPLIEKLWDVLRKNVVTRCAAILTLLVVSTAYVVGSTNSPFLYFNF